MKDDGQEDRGPSAVREPAVIVRGVTKAYGDVQALAGIDIDIEPATVFALLGPNGAGKDHVGAHSHYAHRHGRR